MTASDRPQPLMAPFHGVAPEALYAIGCITVAAGELEWVAREMLRNLYADPGKDLLKPVLKRIRQQVGQGAVPSHAQVAPVEIARWTHDVRDVVGERHEVAHSMPLKRAQESSVGKVTWEAMNMHLRTKALAVLNADRLMDTALQIASVGTTGGRLCRALMHNPRRGVYLPNTALNGEWIPTCTVDAAFEPARPTEAEMDAWWRELGPVPQLGSPPKS